ncbi:MFS transporter [Streptosporangium sp. NPDC000396]|uniref:MFS transporter n=1 Tax=Streptosporangium sp. NPDC000396 TaxID=3366185 RepID=UPI0036CADE77
MVRLDSPSPGTRRRGLVPALIAVALAQLLAMVDLNITATALPAIVGELGRLDLFAWVTTGAVLASTVTTPLYGKLGDVYGRKQVFVLALAVLVAGSVLCGLAGSMTQLVLFRVVQGVGAGGLMVSAIAVYAELLDPAQRMRYQIYFATGLNAFSALSPFAGGFITDWVGWRWTFFLTVPIGLVALALIAGTRLLPRPEAAPGIDYLGASLLGGMCTCLVLLSSWAGSTYSWTSPMILGLGAGAAVLLVLWLRVEKRAPQPIVPLRLFRNPVLVVANLQGFVTGLAMFTVITFLPLLMVATGASATGAGITLLPVTAGALVVSLVGSPLMARHGRPQWYGVVGVALLAAGLAALATLRGDTPPVLTTACTVCFGIGLGLMFQVYSVAVMNNAPRPDLGAALALQSLSRQLGGSLGLAALSGVFQFRLAQELAARLPGGSPGEEAMAAASRPELIRLLPGGLRDAVTSGYGAALGAVFLIAAVIAGLGVLAASALRLPPTGPVHHPSNTNRPNTNRQGADNEPVHPAGPPAGDARGGR